MTSSFRHGVASLVFVTVVLCCSISKAQSAKGTYVGSIDEKVRTLEKACVSTLRTLNAAQITYWGGDNSKGFARTLKQLGPHGEGLLDEATASGEKDGYGFRLVPETISEAYPIKHYKFIAQPTKRLSKSQRSYYTDETGVIRFTDEEWEPTREDSPLRGPDER
jgi:hypothetical protein